MGAFFGQKDWGRLLTAMVTPFHSNGDLNEKEVGRIAKFLVEEQKNDGIVVAGTTGESPTLTEQEKFRILELTLEAVGDKAAVVFGAGSYNTRESIHMTKEASRRGAHGIMLVNPYYNKPGQAGMLAHFSAIAAETDLPVMLYNIQGRSAINLETPTLLKLAEIKNIVAVKEASGLMGQISEVCSQAPEGFRVYSGDDGITLPVLSIGGHGVVSVAAHIVGRQMSEMIHAYQTDALSATKIHKSLVPVWKILFKNPSPVPVKYAMSLCGFDTQTVRLPLVELEEREKRLLEETCKAYIGCNV